MSDAAPPLDVSVAEFATASVASLGTPARMGVSWRPKAASIRSFSQATTGCRRQTDATICGHVFCSFLALALRDELFRRMDNVGVSAEWDDIVRNLNALGETAIAYHGNSFAVPSNAAGVAGKIVQCVGVRLPNTVRQIDVETERTEPGH